MAGFTDAEAAVVLDHRFRGQAAGVVSTYHLGLFSTMPASDGSGGTELSGTGYGRAAITSTDWAAAAGRAIANANTITLSASAGGAWGTAVGFGLFTASSGGTPKYIGVTAAPYVITLGFPVTFAPGLIRLRLPA